MQSAEELAQDKQSTTHREHQRLYTHQRSDELDAIEDVALIIYVCALMFLIGVFFTTTKIHGMQRKQHYGADVGQPKF